MKRFAILFIFIILILSASFAQLKDTAIVPLDSLRPVLTSVNIYGSLLDSCLFLNYKTAPQKLAIQSFTPFNFTWLFYCVAFLFLVFGLIKAFYQRYFDVLVRVFFNTTLKQNQLTDQLVQAKLPSLLFNVLFILFGGTYIFTLMEFLNDKKFNAQNFKVDHLFFAIVGMGLCYVIKYISLLFVGWLTNLQQEAKSYIFIIFLLNKILGIYLLALIPLIIFGNKSISSFAVLLSIVGLVLAFLLRYYRSFTQLKSKFNLSMIHFILAIICLEVLPLVIILKFCTAILNTKA